MWRTLRHRSVDRREQQRARLASQSASRKVDSEFAVSDCLDLVQNNGKLIHDSEAVHQEVICCLDASSLLGLRGYRHLDWAVRSLDRLPCRVLFRAWHSAWSDPATTGKLLSGNQ